MHFRIRKMVAASHQWLFDRSRVHQIRFPPGPRWVAYNAPQTLGSLRGATFKVGDGRETDQKE